MSASTAASEREVLLAITSFVHDEKPLWVATQPESIKIVNLGVPYGKFATAGIYGVTMPFSREWEEDFVAARLSWTTLREDFPFEGASATS
jgi:hypothetical protein